MRFSMRRKKSALVREDNRELNAFLALLCCCAIDQKKKTGEMIASFVFRQKFEYSLIKTLRNVTSKIS